MKNRVLLAVDESPASEAAIDYLARWLNGTDTTIDVVHALPRTAESKIGAKAGRAERRNEAAREDAQPIVMRAVERLKSDGMDPGSIDDGLLYLPPDGSAVDGLLALARENHCDTIVVGRNALPWHHELFHHHLADELLKRADGFTVWVVE